MPRANTLKTVPFSTFKHPRPAPSPPSHSQSQSRFARSEGSLLRSHGLHVDNGGDFTYDSNAVFRPLKDRDKDSTAVCGGYIGLQRGRLRSWVWSWTRKKWVTLHEKYLCASNSKEDPEYTDTLPLNQVHDLYPVESKRFCCAVCTPLETWFLIFGDATMFQTWMTDIQLRCPLLNISSPTTIRHLLHVTYDSDAGQINGLPVPWIKEMGLMPRANTMKQVAEVEAAITPMTEPMHSPTQSSSSHSATTSSSPSQHRQGRRRQQPQPRQEQLSCSMPTPAPLPAAQNLHKRAPSHVVLNGSTSSSSGSKSKSIPNSEPKSRPPPGLIRTQQHYQHYEQPYLSPRGVLASSPSTSTFTQNGRAQQLQQPLQQQPIYHADLDARDLTGLVQTVHLFPIAQQDYWDTWKGKWTGQFGTRQVAIHVLRFTNTSDNNNTHTNQNQSLNNPELVHKFTSILLNELRVLHQLRHPNVVRLRGYTRDLFHTGIGGVPAIVSTWTSDRNIMEYLNDSTSVVSPQRRLKLLAEAASGLSYLHTFPYQVLHGSLRSCQILIQLQPPKPPAPDSEREPVALITGFGFNPLLIDEDAKWALPNVTLSPRWAAPEVIFGGRKEMTDMADVFSFGRCIVEVLTSQQPYPNVDSDARVLSLIVSSTSPSNIESVYYPKPRLRSKQQQQQQQQQQRQLSPAYQTKTPHDIETVRTLLRLWPLLERCWRLLPTNRPSMENVKKGLLNLIDSEG